MHKLYTLKPQCAVCCAWLHLMSSGVELCVCVCVQVHTLQKEVGLLGVNGTCLPEEDPYQTVACPPGLVKLPRSLWSDMCSRHGLTCPQVSEQQVQ